MLPEKYYHRRRVINKVLNQQKEMFTTRTHPVPDRIVSIAKSYVRPKHKIATKTEDENQV